MNKFLSEEYQKSWALSKHPKSFYLILGFVYSQYTGTFNSKEITIQQFIYYKTDSEFEKNKVYNFNKICLTLITELGFTNDLEVKTEEIGDNREMVSFISNNICSYLKSISYTEVNDLFISLFKPTFGTYPLALQQRMEFLSGVYLYHSSGKAKFIFYNNYKKTLLTHQFLVDLSNEEDEIHLTSKFLTPNSHKIELNKDGILWTTMQTILKKRGFEI